MVGNISLDKPLLEQQSVREMLPHLTEGVNAEVRVEDLIKIARAVIHDELVDCGCDKSELTGLKLSYTVTHPEDENLRKVYTTEWNFPKPEVAEGTIENAPETGVNAVANPPISNQVISKLFSRLEEARVSTNAVSTSSSKLTTAFRSSSTRTRRDCDPGLCGQNVDGKDLTIINIVNDLGVIVVPSDPKNCTQIPCKVTPGGWETPID